MKAAFVFSGQGAQKVGMGKDIFDTISTAHELFKKADKILGFSISDICFSGPDTKLTETKYCQPAIYVMSLACLAAFNEKYPEIKPIAAAGLSLGELSALSAAGAFSFETGLKIIEKRAAFMQESCENTQGTMASIMKGELSLIEETCLANSVDVANINSAAQIVISGEKNKIAKTIAALKEKGITKVIALNVAGAYHSRLMKPAEEKLSAYLKNINFNTPLIPVAQNYVGKLIKESSQLKNNVISQVTGSVRWIECVNSIASLEVDTIIEFGPGTVLTGLIKRIKPEINTININSLETLNAFKL